MCRSRALVSLALALLPLALSSLLPLEAERLHASVGGYAVMNCHLDFPFGNEIPYHLQWDKDGDSILSWYSVAGGGVTPATVGDRWGGRVRRVADGRLGLGRGSINVSAVRETDAGLYRCRVTFPNRTPPARNNGTFYYLEVDGGNLILTPPTNVTVLEGDRAELECLPKTRDSRVDWYREGEPLSSLPELAARVELPSNGSLVIARATSTDPGEYSCRVTDNATGGTQSAAAYLDVQYKAKVVYAPTDRYLPLGKPASLDCHFSANPPLTNLRWEKDGFLFDPYNVPGVFYSRNGSLLFNQVDESHEGEYSCTPYNSLGTGGPSPRVRVRVLRPASLGVRPLPLYVARLGASLTLPCALAARAEADESAPRAALVWRREDGAPLPAGRHALAGGNLTLVEVTAEDAGGYECRVEGDDLSAGTSVAARTDLLVENAPPRAPDLLRATPTHIGVHLVWRHGAGGGGAEYTVWYRERAAHEWRTMKILSRGVTEATVTGLRSATDYELRVLAQDPLGDGLFSKPLLVRTKDVEEEPAPEEGALDASRYPPEQEEGEPSAPGGGEATDELEVTVRLLEEGALVRWEAGVGGGAACTVRWYEGDRLAATAHTRQEYLLVRAVAEGGRYAARVRCGAAEGRAALAVPQYGRLRAAAAAVAVVALLLAAAAAALYLARRRLRSRRTKR